MLKIYLLILLITTLLFFSCSREASSQDQTAAFSKDEDGIYVETFPQGDSSINRFTRDNIIYSLNREFVYDYYVLKDGRRLKIQSPSNIGPSTDFQRAWEFVDILSTNSEKIEKISFKVLEGFTNTNQTKVQYKYYCNRGYSECQFYGTSGVIENKVNLWTHPHRDKYFMILELNPFPFVQQPLRIGNKWKWKLKIGEYWGDQRWKKWSGSILNDYDYEITGKEKLETKIGKIDCWIIRAKAVSSLGQTGLLAYFSESCGFMKLDFTNIDDTHLVMEIVEIRN